METQNHDQQREEAIKNVSAKLSFYYHAAVFVVINLMLLAINLLTSPDTLWFYWPLLGWSIGLASHGFQVFAGRGGSAIKQKMIEKEMARLREKNGQGR